MFGSCQLVSTPGPEFSAIRLCGALQRQLRALLKKKQHTWYVSVRVFFRRLLVLDFWFLVYALVFVCSWFQLPLAPAESLILNVLCSFRFRI